VKYLFEVPIPEELRQAGATSLWIAEATLADVKPDPQNPRIHTDSHVGDIERSIDSNGFLDLITITDEGKILEGHGRRKVLEKKGVNKFPVMVVKGLPATNQIIYNIAHNKLTNNAGWMNDGLANIFSGLKMHGIDLTLSGFSVDEITSLTAGWDSDIEKIIKLEATSSTERAVITIKCAQNDKDAVVALIKKAIEDLKLDATIS